MASTNAEQDLRHMGGQSRTDTVVVAGIAAAVALVHLLTNNRYGFHRDELQFLSDARHLDWGFVAYPPLTPFLERIALGVFGVSLVGLRLFSVLAQAIAIVITGWMAREFGGRRLAQVAAALAVALSPLPLFEGTEFQYTSFDYLWWVLIAYFMIRLLKTENPRWWLAIGATAGVGLQTKYAIVFFIAGILGGMLLTRARRYLGSAWFWGGAALALVIFLPNLVWQVSHGIISLHFLQHIHSRDVGEGRANGFLRDQFRICTNLFAAPLWIAGLVCFLRDRRYRLLAWMYLIPLALFLLGKGRGYYLAAAYPMLMAMGAAAGERWAASLRRLPRRTVEAAFFIGLAGCGLYVWRTDSAARVERLAQEFCAPEQRRSARGNRLERAGQDGRRYSGFVARRAAGERGGAGGKLRGAGCNRDPGPRLPLARAHQWNQLGVAARISRAAAVDTDRAGLIA